MQFDNCVLFKEPPKGWKMTDNGPETNHCYIKNKVSVEEPKYKRFRKGACVAIDNNYGGGLINQEETRW